MSAKRCFADDDLIVGDQTIWWSQTGSNRRPHACKARALPAELWPRNQKTNACSRYDVLAFAQGLRRSSLRRRGLAGPKRRARRLVGLGRLELPTSRLSSARSNQLSYKPDEASCGPQGCASRTRRKGRETRTAADSQLSSDEGWDRETRKLQSLERR